jgi:hypothetical protein
MPAQVLAQHRAVRLVAGVVGAGLRVVQTHVSLPVFLVAQARLLVTRDAPGQAACIVVLKPVITITPARTAPPSRPNAAAGLCTARPTTAALVGGTASLASMRWTQCLRYSV